MISRQYAEIAILSTLVILSTAVSSRGQGAGRENPKPNPKKPAVTNPAAPVRKSMPRRTELPLEMVFIKGGTFMMGSPEGMGEKDERPQHQVVVKSFYIGKFEVTEALWRAVMQGDERKYYFSSCPRCPVHSVSWVDAKEFCVKLSRITGREYRLPTEAEWEYAARAGSTGASPENLSSVAWHSSNSDGRKHPVGLKKPNQWGLYDMLGNIEEWCEDSWHDSYVGAPTDGSAWIMRGDYAKAINRGCSYHASAKYCGFAYRGGFYKDPPSYNITLLGFRLAASSD
jgi:eukaryotic-like serine/threonine-protein kinase